MVGWQMICVAVVLCCVGAVLIWCGRQANWTKTGSLAVLEIQRLIAGAIGAE